MVVGMDINFLPGMHSIKKLENNFTFQCLTDISVLKQETIFMNKKFFQHRRTN